MLLNEPSNSQHPATALRQHAYLAYQDGDLDKAQRLCQDYLASCPNDPTGIHILSVITHRQGQHQQAFEYIKKALALKPNEPEIHYSFALLLLLMGHFEQGWQEYEWRLKIKNFKHLLLPLPRWEGESLNGKKLLLLCEQGYGDNIQFSRYLPLVKKCGAHITLGCPLPLQHLFSTLPEIDELSERITPATQQFDAYNSLASLPKIFNTNLSNMPPPTHGLNLDKNHLKKWEKEIPQTGLRIGIVWAGRPGHENDRNRSCRLDDFLPLADIPNTHLISLQMQHELISPSDMPIDIPTAISPDIPLIHLGDRITDFADTAAIIHHLDLIISVDTSLAHLAATLGKETWVLLPFVPEWRWLLDRDDSPWYPKHMKLFRQTKIGDWKHVFEDRVKPAVQKFEKIYQVS